MQRRTLVTATAFAATALAAIAAPAWAQSGEIRIAHVTARPVRWRPTESRRRLA